MGFIRDNLGVDLSGIYGGITGTDAENAANVAANTQNQTAMANADLFRESRDIQRADLQPFRDIANEGTINNLRWAGTVQPDYSYNPDTDQLLNNMLSRVSRSVMDAKAAQGKAGSGGTLTALTEAMAPIYMQRQGQMFDQQYNTQNQRFNQLQNLVSMSQNAAAGQGNATANATNNIADMYNQAANAHAAGTVGASNAGQQGINNMLSIFGALTGGSQGATGEALYSMGFSDVRLKSNIVHVGKFKNHNVYEYDIFGRRERGVMAQEVLATKPNAVHLHESGYYMVNYGAL